MKLKDFKNLINKAENKLLKPYYKGGVCYLLDKELKQIIYLSFKCNTNTIDCEADCLASLFDIVCCPKHKTGYDMVGVDNLWGLWLGYFTLENIPRRIDTLRFFEQYCISEKLYEKF